MNEVLQSVAESEQSEEKLVTDSSCPNKRIRFSGAARRRYKKQRQEGEQAEKAQGLPPAAGLCLTDKGGNAEVGAQKRTKPEHNTLSPSAETDKRLKIIDGGTYAQTKGIIRMALVPEGYPDRKLGDGEVGETRKLIRGCILELPEGTLAPTFTGTWIRNGAIFFGCTNQQSADWLKSLSGKLRVEDSPLRVLSADELFKRHRVVVHVEESDLAAEETIKLLDRQNTGLAAGEWVVIRESESRDAKSAHFAAFVSKSSLEALKNCGFKPFCGLGRATVKLLAERNVSVEGTRGMTS